MKLKTLSVTGYVMILLRVALIFVLTYQIMCVYSVLRYIYIYIYILCYLWQSRCLILIKSSLLLFRLLTVT